MRAKATLISEVIQLNCDYPCVRFYQRSAYSLQDEDFYKVTVWLTSTKNSFWETATTIGYTLMSKILLFCN